MNYFRFLNAVSKARKRSPLRLLTEIQYNSPPSLISMATGMPNPDQFPFKDAQFTLSDGTVIDIDEEGMRTALQYNPSSGFRPLLKWLTDFQKLEHNPPLIESTDEDKHTDLLLTTGSQHGLAIAMEMMITPGDKILLGSPIYPGLKAVLEPLGAEFLLLETDEHGLKPESLSKMLSKWSPSDAKNEDCKIPKMLYTVPNGDNPSGTCISLDRRKEIYDICHKYDLLILEDDPYYFLQFAKPRIPSFSSMDVDGRVLRFDSFSKLLSSGLRVGFVTGPRALTFRIMLHVEATVLHSSTLSHILVFKLLEKWGVNGFLQHAEKVAEFYQQRRDVMLKACDKWLTGIAEWNIPTGGMFIWIKLPNVPDTLGLIMNKAKDKDVLFVPGEFCLPTGSGTSSYLRACYSKASDEQIDEGMRRLSLLIKEEIQ